MDQHLSGELHKLEQEFGLPARQILDIINRRNRCKIAVRGAIAEAHLLQYLQRLKASEAISDFEDFDLDGYPDCRVDYGDRSFLIECKNVEKERQPGHPITVDFQRTRNQKNDPAARFYAPGEFDILAACLWNRTGQWTFRFAATKDLPRHARYPERLDNHVTVVIDTPAPGARQVWFAELPALLACL